MGHARKRPIAGSISGTGDRLIVIEAFQRPTTLQLVLNGGSATVEYTVQNILYDNAAKNTVNLSSPSDDDRYVDPSSASWVPATVTAGIATLDVPAFAIRINVTVAGTPSVNYHIAQA